MINLVSLSKLAVELNVNKSKLNYYTWRKLLVPAHVCGKAMLFDRKETIKRFKQIQAAKLNGLSLEAIRERLK